MYQGSARGDCKELKRPSNQKRDYHNFHLSRFLEEKLMRDLKEQEMESDLRSQQVENWKTAEETECDKVLHRLLALGKKDDEIVSIFCDDLDNRPKFNKMIYVNSKLVNDILFAWDNCLDANITDLGEARETNKLPGRYEDFNDSVSF